MPIIDTGMQRVPGSPEVATIMFRKIKECAIFVGDVTLVGEMKRPAGSDDPPKQTANPNVMVEMGYAAATIGWERIICVMNEKFGKAEEQPVDVRNRRFPIDYELDETREGEGKVLKQLTKDLKQAIEAVHTYELDSANQACSLLDINCMDLIAAAGKYEWFSAPSEATVLGGRLDTPKFMAAIMRLLDLGLIWTDFAPQRSAYAYHWTYKGRKVCDKLGYTIKQTDTRVST